MRNLSNEELSTISGGIEVSGISLGLGVASFASAFALGQWNQKRKNASYFANYGNVEQGLHDSIEEVSATISKIIDESNLSSPSDASVKVY